MPRLGTDAVEPAFGILDKARMGVTPDVDFGSRDEGYLRRGDASSLKDLREAMRRLECCIAPALRRAGCSPALRTCVQKSFPFTAGHPLQAQAKKDIEIFYLSH